MPEAASGDAAMADAGQPPAAAQPLPQLPRFAEWNSWAEAQLECARLLGDWPEVRRVAEDVHFGAEELPDAGGDGDEEAAEAHDRAVAAAVSAALAAAADANGGDPAAELRPYARALLFGGGDRGREALERIQAGERGRAAEPPGRGGKEGREKGKEGVLHAPAPRHRPYCFADRRRATPPNRRTRAHAQYQS